jgi:hypothetical protein
LAAISGGVALAIMIISTRAQKDSHPAQIFLIGESPAPLALLGGAVVLGAKPSGPLPEPGAPTSDAATHELKKHWDTVE